MQMYQKVHPTTEQFSTMSLAFLQAGERSVNGKVEAGTIFAALRKGPRERAAHAGYASRSAWQHPKHNNVVIS